MLTSHRVLHPGILSCWLTISLTTIKLDDCLLPKFNSNTIENNGDQQAMDVEREEGIAIH